MKKLLLTITALFCLGLSTVSFTAAEVPPTYVEAVGEYIPSAAFVHAVRQDPARAWIEAMRGIDKGDRQKVEYIVTQRLIGPRERNNHPALLHKQLTLLEIASHYLARSLAVPCGQRDDILIETQRQIFNFLFEAALKDQCQMGV
jgi:hypothetical protein